MPHADPVERQRYNREYKRANRWRYAARQKTYDAAKHANERAARYGRPGTITPEDVECLFSAGACIYCHAVTVNLTVDHRVGLHDPRSTNTPDNLVPACKPCNASKMREEKPWKWSRRYDCCQDCGTTERKHSSGGLCSRCYSREYERSHPDRRVR